MEIKSHAVKTNAVILLMNYAEHQELECITKPSKFKAPKERELLTSTEQLDLIQKALQYELIKCCSWSPIIEQKRFYVSLLPAIPKQLLPNIHIICWDIYMKAYTYKALLLILTTFHIRFRIIILATLVTGKKRLLKNE
jgi:hypothetical protein